MKWILSKSPDWQTKQFTQSVEATINGCPVYQLIIPEYVKDITIKMATSTMVIPHYKQHCFQYTKCI